MPQRYTGRVVTIAILLLVALIGIPGIGGGIFPLSKLLDSSIPWGKKVDLKPGIDINGGTKLLYEIKVPPNTTENLSDQMAAALKKRVDPDGVKNLVWRPQPNNRLEIQIPRTDASDKSKEIKDNFAKAARDLTALDISAAAVQRAVETLSGADREAALNKLAMDSAARKALFAKLVSDFTTKNDANASPEAQAKADIAYTADLKKIDDTGINVQLLKDILDETGDAKARDQELSDFKQKYADFPEASARIQKYIDTYAPAQKLKDSVDDAAEFKRLLHGSGVLEFHILVETGDPSIPAMVERIKEKGPAPLGGDTMRWYELDKPKELSGKMVSANYGKKIYVLAYISPEASPGMKDHPLALVHQTSVQWGLQTASRGQAQSGAAVVNFTFDAQGAALFGELTGQNIDHMLGIVLDDKLISAPNVNSRIGAEGQISGGGQGGFSEADLDYLIKTLQAGSLPAQLADSPISEVQIGPSIGQENLHKGLIASFIGLVVVAVFLVGYYFIAGIVATVAVFMNLILILGVLACFKATFTLPGIAGIALTVGMAVDANVLIFERFREELHRGLSARMALRNAYDRAFTAILDSNVTTAITSVILYWLGSEEVKGFGLTLLIGILSSLFTALFVTKTIFGIMIDKFEFNNFASIPSVFPKWDRFLRPNIDWIGKAWFFVVLSLVMMVAGIAAFIAQGRQMYDIEFASGTSVQFEMKEKPDHTAWLGSEIQTMLATQAAKLPSMNVVSVGDTGREFEVVTPNTEVTDVRDGVLTALRGKLQLEEPSDFDLYKLTAAQALDQKVVVPIQSSSQQFGGITPPDLTDYIGGVGIELNHLQPPLSPNEVIKRLDIARQQAGSASHASWRVAVDRVDGLNQPDAVSDHLVVFVSDPNFLYDKDPAAWQSNLALPAWTDLVLPGVHHEASLQSVNNFNPQVAADAQQSAIMATTLSVLVIMAYIWLRFGNLKYATATVVAMLHDTVLTIGFIGISHYIASNAIGHALLVEPFRVNLTLVAAILTIMGYSMIDTIVVFDRIRENRGRFGYISRQVVNDSINQTLSRTLLTCSTTIFTVATMYIFGGPGIHGFTFVLLVGILVGTYSSVAIASPILLIGAGDKKAAESGNKPPIGAVQRAGA